MFTGLKLFALALVLGVCLALWNVASRSIDRGEDTLYKSQLSRLQETDTALASEVLRSRSGMVNHYDVIVRTIGELRLLCEWLEQSPAHFTKAGATEIVEAIKGYEESLDLREAQIDTFKFNHAILGNSLRFFPQQAMLLADRLGSTPDGQELSSVLRGLYSDVPLYYLFGESSRRERLESQLSQLNTESLSPVAPATRKSIELLVKHSTVIMETKPKVEAAIAAMLAVPSASRVNELRATYMRHHRGAAAAEQSARRIAWLSALALVLAMATLIILRIRRAAADLALASQELQTALNNLEIEKEKHKDLAELKSRFVSMTSHEFRTPLSVVLSSAELLQAYGAKWPEEKRQTYLGRVQQATHYMKHMLDEVLLIGKVEAGKLEASPTVVDILPFCERLVESMKLHGGVEHEIEIASDEELQRVHVDEVLLTHVIDNLLSNAVKYSPDAKKVVMTIEQIGPTLVFRVEDSGIGIAQEDQDRLFESFHRGTNVGTISGTGLGLAVVKRSLEVLSGSIKVESVVGEGSCFEVSIPAPSAEAEGMRDSA